MYSFIFVYSLDSEEKRDKFFAELTENNIESKCAAEDGCNMYKYLMAPGDKTHIYIVESWVDEKAQQVHCTQLHCEIIQALKKKYGVESSKIEI